VAASSSPRARSLGIPFDGRPGKWNAITDVPGVEVGHITLVRGEGALQLGAGPVRTGVSAVLPLGREGVGRACPAGLFSLNGNGELTGSHWIAETGGLSSPVMLTNTHAVGSVHRGVVDWCVAHRPGQTVQWLLPVVGETWDGYLNDINGGHVTPEHAGAAIDAARSGPVAEGSVGGGTGMVCYGWSGGVGTSSRMVRLGSREHVVGAYVQANFGDRGELRLAGVPLGDLPVANPIDEPGWFARDHRRAGGDADGGEAGPGGAGSVIVLVATDAPMLPAQCSALARRVSLGLARTGTTGSHFSGDIFLAWSTAGAGALDSRIPLGPADPPDYRQLDFVPWSGMDAFYVATVQAVEEAVANALVVNADKTGRDGNWVPALPHQMLVERLSARGVLQV
jgi:L-aminopeptidase/D-esterase-like protein